MKGLLRNNFYSLGSNLQLSFILSNMIMVIALVVDHNSIVSMLLAMQSFLFIANIGSALKVDVASNWNKFELTMPVRRTSIIQARYISFVFLIFLGLFFSSVTVLIKSFMFGEMEMTSVFFGFTYGMGLSIFTAAFMYPLMLKFGAEKSEMIIIICALLAAGIYMLIPYVFTVFSNDITLSMSDPLIGVTCIVLAVALFIISYFVSLAMYKRKEL